MACAAALTLSGVAIAQEQTISGYVRMLITETADAGEMLVDDIQIEELEEDGSTEFYFDIDPDKTYFVYGACDDDCSDIDLEAHDADEAFVDSDTEDDDAPMLTILPGESGDELHVVVSLSACETDVCVVGVGLYETGE